LPALLAELPRDALRFERAERRITPFGSLHDCCIERIELKLENGRIRLCLREADVEVADVVQFELTGELAATSWLYHEWCSVGDRTRFGLCVDAELWTLKCIARRIRLHPKKALERR